jgi:NAD(P)-dependent dehydrogenase (short-subunit alcohol dehydrogenase family)
MLKVAITGCATGIGAQSARILRSRGAHVTGFDVADGSDVVDRFIPLDLSSAASIAKAAEAAAGSFDALCNIAGLPPKSGARTAVRILEVNFVGTRLFTEALMPKLAPGASIVNMASRAGSRWRDNLEQVKALLAIHAHRDVPDFCLRNRIDDVRAYDLSKEAIIAWTLVATEPLLARELRINSISPGAITTRIYDDFIAAFGERATRQIARAGRAGRPEEVAELVAFLASPESGWIKGVDINIDGGKGAFAACDALGLTGMGRK